MVNNREASHLKLHLLSEGVTFTESFLEKFGCDFSLMEKRRAYNNSDDAHLDLQLRVPQEIIIGDVVIAVKHKKDSPWQLEFKESYYLSHYGKPVTLVSFPFRPLLFDQKTPKGIRCDAVANLYGGSSLAFFTPSTCYYFKNGFECKFCSLEPTRDNETTFVHTITPEVASDVFRIALSSDPNIFKQIMLVGGNIPDYNLGFKNNLRITKSLNKTQEHLPASKQLEIHIATMPPRDLELINEFSKLNARLTMNLEVFDDQIFEILCSGKARDYGRENLKRALQYASKTLPDKRVHSILIAGLEPISSTIEGIKTLVSMGVTPIINVFHSDRGSPLENLSQPSYENLLSVALELEKVYQQYELTPYWNGCGRNSLDFEALHGWFS
ncbi:MAG: hypothetical protein JNM55_20185 [Anaerolineales bacterium]|nr:hypothetical protein [Anaerolineales bacterium]